MNQMKGVVENFFRLVCFQHQFGQKIQFNTNIPFFYKYLCRNSIEQDNSRYLH